MTRSILGATIPILLLGLLSVGMVGAGSRWSTPVKDALETITSQELLRHVTILASEEYQGRRVGTIGAMKAGDYVADHFAALGLQPGGVDGTYFHPFALKDKEPREGPLSEVNTFRFGKKKGDRKARDLEYGKDFIPHSHTPEGSMSGSVRFLGFEAGIGPSVDDEIDGRVVALLKPVVQNAPITEQLRGLVADLAKRGATGVLLLPSSLEGPALASFSGSKVGKEQRFALPVIELSADATDRLFSKAGKKFRRTIAKLASGSVPAVSLDRCHVDVRVRRSGWRYEEGRNVVAFYPGTDPKLKDEAIVLGAHYDHLGYPTSKRVSLGTLRALHNGADDNASGTGGLIEVAEAFMSGEVPTGRTIIFIAFDGEEFGLLGSKAWCESPTWPLEKVKAMLNIDMISRNAPRMMKFGTDEDYVGLNSVIRGVASRFKIKLDTEGMRQYWRRSDHYPFVQKGIPACFLFGGMHRDYHTENDDVERINKLKAETIARLMFLMAYECSVHDGPFDQ